jgi:hypothetical protein
MTERALIAVADISIAEVDAPATNCCPRGSASCSGKGKGLVQFALQYHQVVSFLQSGYPSAARLRFFRLLDSVPYFPR